MSMLAERKHKQKWCLNPRGNLWSEDKSKFGKRMLEKMGWTDGKGLGAKEDGATEHVKVSYKNDSKGIGFKENGEQWTEHEDNFTSLLKSLDPVNAAAITEKPVLSGKSLEVKSKNARSRVHYHKFTRGKDLSRYSEKDLANIFGKKSLKPAQKPTETTEQSKNADAEQGAKEESVKFGVETIERGNMVDYFKKKFPHFNMKGSYEVGANGVLKLAKVVESDSESDARGGFGFGFSQTEKTDEKPIKTSFVSYVKATETTHEPPEQQQGEKKKKKKRKNTDSSDENVSKRTKTDEDGAFVNPAFDPLSRSKIVGVKHSLTTITEEQVDEGEVTQEEQTEEDPNEDKTQINETPKQRKDKTKKHRRLSEITGQDSSNCFSNETTVDSFEDEVGGSCIWEEVALNPYEVKRKPKKDKKQKSIEKSSKEDLSYCNGASVNDNFVDADDGIGDGNVLELYEVKRKSKKSKKKKSQDVQDNADEDVEDGLDKKSSKNDKIFALDNEVSLNHEEKEGCLNVSDELGKEVADDSKSKKRKFNKSNSIDSNSFNSGLSLSDEADGRLNGSKDIQEEVSDSSKRKKKKLMKSQSNESGLDNPALNLSMEAAGCLNGTTDFGDEISQTSASVNLKKSQSSESGLDNPALNLSAEDIPETSKSKKKKQKKSQTSEIGLDNLALNLTLEAEERLNRLDNLSINTFQEQDNTSSASEDSQQQKNEYNYHQMNGLYNPGLSLNSSYESQPSQQCMEVSKDIADYEVKRKPKKSKKKNRKAGLNFGLDNPGLNLGLANEITENADKENDLIGLDATFQTVTDASFDFKTPNSSSALRTAADSSAKRRKSVRFSEVNEERIIPNLVNPENNAAFGLDNEGFDLVSNVFTEGVENLNNALDEFQNELENDMNEKKLQEQQKLEEATPLDTVQLQQQNERSTSSKRMRGNGNSIESNAPFRIEPPSEEDLKDGVVLKYTQGKLSKYTVSWKSDNTSAKKSYKHLIQGDILLQFKGTNFHQVEGYAVKSAEKTAPAQQSERVS